MTTDDKAGDEQLLTTQEAARMLGINEKTLYAWRKIGDIAPVPGNTAKAKEPRHYRLSDVQDILKNGRKSQRKAND